MKHLLLLLIPIFLCSCNTERENTAKQFIEENLPKNGFNVTVNTVKKINGISYTSKYTGEDLYALEFVAICTVNDNGFVFINENNMVNNNTIFETDPSNGDPNYFDFIPTIKEVRSVKPGDIIQYTSNVIMQKTDNGWEPLDIRGDLY